MGTGVGCTGAGVTFGICRATVSGSTDVRIGRYQFNNVAMEWTESVVVSTKVKQGDIDDARFFKMD